MSTYDPPSGGGGAVASVFGRTGVVVAEPGDYTAAQVGADASGAAAAAQTAAEAYSDSNLGALEADLGSLAYVTPTGTGTAATFLRGDDSWNVTAPLFFFNMPTATIATSPPYPPLQSAAEAGTCYLSCTGAAVGSALTMVARYSTNGGSTWTTIITLTIAAGSTTSVSGTANVSIPSGAIIDCQCTSDGSTTPATGVVFSGFPE